MSFGPYRKNAAKWLQATISQSRHDLSLPSLKWFLSQQLPTDMKGNNTLDVTKDLAEIGTSDSACIHLKIFDLPPQREKLVITTEGIVRLGEKMAQGYLEFK